MAIQAEHEHHHPQGRVFEAVYPISMLCGRGAMARAVAQLAGLTAGDVVVDVGCGTGTAARRARREGAGRIVGIDPSPRMLRLARRVTALRRTDGVIFLEGSAENLPLDADSATVVWALQSVHHWEDVARGLREALRVLAPDGRLLLLERHVTPGARGHAAHGLTDPQADELARQAEETGFISIERRMIRARRRDFVVTTAVAPSS